MNSSNTSSFTNPQHDHDTGQFNDKKRRNRSILWAFLILIAVGAGIWLLPDVIGLFYQYNAGYLFRKTGLLDDQDSRMEIPCVAEPVTDYSNQLLLRRVIESSQTAIKYDPDLIEVYLILGRAYCMNGEPGLAVVAYQNYINHKPNNPLGNIELGFAYAALVDPASAVEEWKKAKLTTQDMINSGIQIFKLNDYRGALKWFDSASWLDPENGEVWYHKGLVYEQLGDWDLSLDSFNKSRELTLNSNRIASNIYFHIGYILQGKIDPPNLEEANEYFDRAIFIDHFDREEDKIQTHLFRGDNYRLRSQYTDAIKEYRWVLDHSPNNYWANVWLGRLTWEIYNDVMEARKLLDKAISMRPKQKEPYLILGEIYRTVGDNFAAESVYLDVLQLDPDDQTACDYLNTCKP